MIDGAVPQVSDCIEDGSSVLEEVSSSRLSIDEQVLLPDLHIGPIHGDFSRTASCGALSRPVSWDHLVRGSVTLIPAPRRI